MLPYIKKLILDTHPVYFIWDDVVDDFVSYYRAIFKAKDGNLYLFRCFFSDTSVAKEPMALFLADLNVDCTVKLESIGILKRISSFKEGKYSYELSKERLHSIQCFLENILKKVVFDILSELSDMQIEVKIFWRPVVSIACYVLEKDSLLGIILLQRQYIIPLSGDVYKLGKAIHLLKQFWQTGFSVTSLLEITNS